MYAITGVTGKVGAAAARQLLAAGRQVRAVMRDAAKAPAWRQSGCDIAYADMRDAEALTAAFAGVEGVFVLIPPIFDPKPGFPEIHAIIAALTKALLASKPGKIVCLSTVGAQAKQPNLLNQLGLVEQALGALPGPVCFLRAAWFMENAALDVAPARDGATPCFLQPLDRAIPMVATADIGHIVADLLQQQWRGRRIVELEGPKPVAPNDIAAGFSRLLGHPVTPQIVPRADWEALFRTQGIQNPTPRMQMLDGFNEGWIAFEGADAEHVFGETKLETVLAVLLGA